MKKVSITLVLLILILSIMYLSIVSISASTTSDQTNNKNVIQDSQNIGKPYYGAKFNFKQPDGSSVPVKVWGDEYYQRVESMDGYTLVRDPETHWICYANINSSKSDFVSTGIKYTSSNKSNAPSTIDNKVNKRLKLNKTSVKEKAQAKKNFIEAKRPRSMPNLLNEAIQKSQINTNTNTNPSYAPSNNSYTTNSTTNSYITDSKSTNSNANSTSIKGLTILIDFSDQTSTITSTDVSNMLNQTGYSRYSNNGSCKDYFYIVSGGAVTYTNEVIGYYRASNPKAYYDTTSDKSYTKAAELVKEALTYFDSQGYDFSKLSLDSKGYVRAVNVFYAGKPESGWATGLWPHSGYLDLNVNGAKISRYQLSNIGSELSIGTVVHENGHMLFDWRDLYDYDGDSKGTGQYCIMSSVNDKNPMPPNPYFRSLAGWAKITELSTLANETTISVNSGSLDVYKYSGKNTNEFFMVENIQKKGRWAGSPDDGLMIWHIDTTGHNSNNQMTSSSHFLVSVEQADNKFDLENNINLGGANDLYHNGNANSFSDYTLPSAKWWDGTDSNLNIFNISDSGSTMTFTINSSN